MHARVLYRSAYSCGQSKRKRGTRSNRRRAEADNMCATKAGGKCNHTCALNKTASNPSTNTDEGTSADAGSTAVSYAVSNACTPRRTCESYATSATLLPARKCKAFQRPSYRAPKTIAPTTTARPRAKVRAVLFWSRRPCITWPIATAESHDWEGAREDPESVCVHPTIRMRKTTERGMWKATRVNQTTTTRPHGEALTVVEEL